MTNEWVTILSFCFRPINCKEGNKWSVLLLNDGGESNEVKFSKVVVLYQVRYVNNSKYEFIRVDKSFQSIGFTTQVVLSVPTILLHL